VVITVNKKNEKNKEKIIKNVILNQKGMALLTTLIFVFVLVSLGVALLTMTNNDSKLSTLQRESNKAFYLADAGIEDTLWKLNTTTEDGGQGVNWRPTNEPDDPGTATEYYQVTVEGPLLVNKGDTVEVLITSVGKVLGGQFSSGKRTIEVTAEIDYIITSMYDYAILSDKIILFQGDPGPDVVGDVHSNDAILVSPPDGTFVENYPGTATSGGDTNILNPDNVNSGTIDIPFVDYPELKSKAEAAEIETGVIHYHDGNVILGNDDTRDWTGIHYIEGNLEAKNGSTINVTNGAIIATGDVDVKEGATFNINNDPINYVDPTDPITALALVAQGDIKIYAKAEIAEGVVQSVLADGYTTEGFIELKNGCEVTGAVIADTVYLRNKTAVNYTSILNKFTTKGDPFFKKTSWREAY